MRKMHDEPALVKYRQLATPAFTLNQCLLYCCRLAKEVKLKSDVGVLPSALPGKQHNPVSRRLRALVKALKERNPAEAAKPRPRCWPFRKSAFQSTVHFVLQGN